MNNLRGMGDQSLRFQWLICAELMANLSGFADQSKRNFQNEKVIQEYIKRQLEEDQRIDQLSLIEYTDPFTGEPVGKGKKKAA